MYPATRPSAPVRPRPPMPSLPFFLPLAYRTLIWQLGRREVLGRYRGSLLGVGWSFVTPVMMLAVYTFVFVDVFKARWPGAGHGSGGGLTFALYIFAGLIVFNLFAEIAGRAPRLVVDQPNLVKKVAFPLEILPWVAVLSGLFHLALSVLVLLAAVAFLHPGGVQPSAAALPLVLLPFLPFLLGLGWLLSALGVFIRDIGQIMNFVVSLAMFLSPVFYPLESLSEPMRTWMYFNPLTTIIDNVRRVLLQGLWPDWNALALFAAAASAFAVLAAVLFQATRKGFADVL